MGTMIVDGHEGAGKSTLIQRLLESNKSRAIQVSRCLAKPGFGQWRETPTGGSSGKSPDQAQLDKWLDAGAAYANLLTYDPSRIDIETLIMEAGQGFGDLDEWVIEGENVAYSCVHCSVFVLRPLPESARLVETKERIVAHMPLDEYLRYSAGELPDESVAEDDESVEEAQFDLPFDEELPEKLAAAGVVLNDSEKVRLRTLLQDGIPIRSKQPELRPECARLPAAEVVIINLHDDAERARAEATRIQILNLFKDWTLRYQLGFRSQVTRAGVYLANLQNPGDSGTKAALAQIKRKLRGR
ncbi:MAG: hypothetical protein ABSH28_09165 [Acidobacteriota bacterium]